MSLNYAHLKSVLGTFCTLCTFFLFSFSESISISPLLILKQITYIIFIYKEFTTNNGDENGDIYILMAKSSLNAHFIPHQSKQNHYFIFQSVF